MADLPSLNALKAFDAAAKHLSFTRAAEALFVTHGAVSRQVKELEEFLGLPLFKRHPRGLELTAQGRQLATRVVPAFDELRRVVAEVRRQPRQNVITVSTVPSLAARWLVPRLSKFQKAHPNTEIHVVTGHSLVDFQRDAVDLALRYGKGPWRGCYSETLFDSQVFPVCAPQLLEGARPLREPRDLRHFALLHDMSHFQWTQWLQQAGASGVDAQTGLVLEDSNVLLQAVIEGEGVALASAPLVYSDLRTGRLVRPFEMAIRTDIAFHVVCAQGRETDPVLEPFITWLRQEARSMTSG